MKHINESGRSMVEILGVLAIIGVLSVGGIAGYSMAMSKFKITKTLDQVQTLVTNLRALYASQRTYTQLTPKKAYEMSLLTDETFDKNTSKGVNPYGGEIKFDATGGRTFSIEYTGLTAEACLKLSTADWGADASSGLVSIGVGGYRNTVSKTFTWSIAPKLPVELTEAAEACKGETATDNTGVVKWTFR